MAGGPLYWLSTDEKPRTAKIDISGMYASSGLYARKIWEALYRLVDAHTFGTLDNFLCDLEGFRILIDKRPDVIYWSYHRASGATVLLDSLAGASTYRVGLPSVLQFQVWDEFPDLDENTYKIELRWEERQFLITQMEDYDARTNNQA